MFNNKENRKCYEYAINKINWDITIEGEGTIAENVMMLWPFEDFYSQYKKFLNKNATPDQRDTQKFFKYQLTERIRAHRTTQGKEQSIDFNEK